MIALFDTARGQVTPLKTRQEGAVSMYVCGPTVYGPPHLGHGRFSLVFDVLRRYLTWSGYEVTYVSNITDIDDKIINRAAEEGRPWQEVVEEFEQVWFDAMDELDVLRPNHTPHATEYVAEMLDLIGELLRKDRAYITSDGIYLDVASVEGYGLLAHQSMEDLIAGGGERAIVGESEKRTSADFALWKFVKPGEPSWPSPWGDGRPGWHTECVVMSLDLLGEGFDIHGGGLDLAFPHHENERAQAVALGRDFAVHWVHNGFVEVGGEKMSKSLNNFTTLVDLLERHDGRAYRLIVLQSHYRSPVEVTDKTLTAAESALGRLDGLARRVSSLDLDGIEPDGSTLDAFRAFMNDDLDTPHVVAQVFGLASTINKHLDAGEEDAALPLIAALLEITGALGLSLNGDSAEVPDDVAQLVADREAARAAKDWQRSDQLRDQLLERGWVVEDGAGGAVVRPK